MSDSSLLPFFNPKGVLVVGASTSPEKLGYGVARNLTQSGFPGSIHFLGQKSGELFGRKIFTDLKEIPNPIDLAILITPPQTTPEIIESCGKRGIRAAIIVSAGFREVGSDGAALEQKCIEAALAHGVRLLGPNCIGVMDTHLPLDTTFLQSPLPAQGGIGFISHSGAFCAAVIDWSQNQAFGFSRIVSLGNQADVSETDMLSALAEDDDTKVIVMYLESVSNGGRFVEIAREVAQRKPVIALKVGRSEAGQKAAASHTGALAAADNTFDAAFEKSGVLRANSTQQMFDWAKALENCPLSKGRRIGVLTNAGGLGVIAADSLEQCELSLANLSESAREALTTILPPSASTLNPVDMLASASPETYAACLKIMLDDSNLDAAMVILPPPPMFKAEDVASRLVEATQNSDKPVVVVLPGSTLIEQAKVIFQQGEIPTFEFPEGASSALSALCRRADFLQASSEHNPQIIPSKSIKPGDLDALLEAYSIPIPRTRLAQNTSDAVTFANEIGYPVVMKIASPDISHKSDIGGVLLNIQSDEEVRRGYGNLISIARTASPAAQVDGVTIQKQFPEGQEVIVGMVRDPLFGPLMMFGSGGVEVEGLKDVAFALAPLNKAEAEKMIRKTWAGKKLKGFRNIPPADEESAMEVVINLSWLAIDHEEIQEIEINPLRVFQKSSAALDVRWKTVVQ